MNNTNPDSFIKMLTPLFRKRTFMKVLLIVKPVLWYKFDFNPAINDIFFNNKIKNLKSILIYQEAAIKTVLEIGVNLSLDREYIEDRMIVINPNVMTIWWYN